jgi:uncharacterized protein YbjQ (UPF0145 family)
MIASTTRMLESHGITRYHGIVTGEAMLGAISLEGAVG